MTHIALLSDTHNYLDESILKHLQHCDEIWHAGDFGTALIADKLLMLKPLKGVYGNIDGYDIRSMFPETLSFYWEEVKVLMKHIGGYPGRYATGVKDLILKEKPALFISGHSHILKVMYDDKLKCLHINPGAAGIHGWHKIRTMVRFVIDGKNISKCEVIELGNRAAIIKRP